MTKEELIEFLKDNLEIKLINKPGYYDTNNITAELLLNGEVISEDFLDIYI